MPAPNVGLELKTRDLESQALPTELARCPTCHALLAHHRIVMGVIAAWGFAVGAEGGIGWEAEPRENQRSAVASL